MLIFDKSQQGRFAKAQVNSSEVDAAELSAEFRRTSALGLPECSELDVVRHYTSLSRKNFSIDTNFYPLGSCTMKYNPRGAHAFALQPGFTDLHPHMPQESMQGVLEALHRLQGYLAELTGMKAVTLAPMAGSQGEFTGCAMIRAYHDKHGAPERNEMIVPDAAHGTNPASAVKCGFKVIEVKTAEDGDINLDEIQNAISDKTAGIMLTNPSTLGTFTKKIKSMAKLIHDAGGLLYYDGANLNAILGKVRPGDMGFDVIHLNLHKTFATPHGGGGPGSGPVGVCERLREFLPYPYVTQAGDGDYRLTQADGLPDSIGRLSAFFGNTAILLRAYAYARLLGKEGLQEVAEIATLNANYLMAGLREMGYTLAYPDRRASHEFIVTLQPEKKAFGIGAGDVAKRLLDYGIHAPTIYFPLLVPECLLIEPTETESLETLNEFLRVMKQIREEMSTEPSLILEAPHNCSVRRVDEVKAARELNLTVDLEHDS